MTFSEEPAVWVGAIGALVAVAVAFGAPITPEQKEAILAALPLVAGVIIRSQVSPAQPPPHG